jgi:hypothetical protein
MGFYRGFMVKNGFLRVLYIILGVFIVKFGFYGKFLVFL